MGDPTQNPQAIVSSKGSKKFSLGGKKTKILIGVIVLVIIGTGVFLSTNRKQGITATEATKQATDYSNQGQHDKAKDVLQEYLAQNPKNASDKGPAEQQLSEVYVAMGDTANAQVWQQKAIADNVQPSINAYINIAVVAESKNDKATALKYYKLANDLNDKTPSNTQVPDGIFLKIRMKAVGG